MTQVLQRIQGLQQQLLKQQRLLATADLVSSLQESEAFRLLQLQLDAACERYRDALLHGTDELPPYKQGEARGALSILNLLSAKTSAAVATKLREAIKATTEEITKLSAGIEPALSREA